LAGARGADTWLQIDTSEPIRPRMVNGFIASF